MEISNSIFGNNLATKTVAFAAAVVTTASIATGTLVVFTGNAHTIGNQIAHAAVAPVRALLGA
jgi:hypothetical protein